MFLPEFEYGINENCHMENDAKDDPDIGKINIREQVIPIIVPQRMGQNQEAQRIEESETGISNMVQETSLH